VSTYDEYRDELDELLDKFAATVRLLRQRRPGYSQEALAADARLHRTEMSKIECGERDPRLSTLLILAEALEVSLDVLVEGLRAPRHRRPSPQAKLGRTGGR
jgi:transcriptional regulator with XRE-family HTH domain